MRLKYKSNINKIFSINKKNQHANFFITFYELLIIIHSQTITKIQKNT